MCGLPTNLLFSIVCEQKLPIEIKGYLGLTNESKLKNDNRFKLNGY